MTVPTAPKKHGGAKPDINVTPLVDIVLVLLIIFMVVTPQMESGENIDLPSVNYPDEEAKLQMDPLELTRTFSGRYLIDKDEVKESEVEGILRAAHEKDPTRRLVVKADMKLTYDDARKLFLLAKNIGYPGVSLKVSEKQGEQQQEEEDEQGATAPAPNPNERKG